MFSGRGRPIATRNWQLLALRQQASKHPAPAPCCMRAAMSDPTLRDASGKVRAMWNSPRLAPPQWGGYVSKSRQGLFKAIFPPKDYQTLLPSNNHRLHHLQWCQELNYIIFMHDSLSNYLLLRPINTIGTLGQDTFWIGEVSIFNLNVGGLVSPPALAVFSLPAFCLLFHLLNFCPSYLCYLFFSTLLCAFNFCTGNMKCKAWSVSASYISGKGDTSGNLLNSLAYPDQEWCSQHCMRLCHDNAKSPCLKCVFKSLLCKASWY